MKTETAEELSALQAVDTWDPTKVHGRSHLRYYT